MGFLGGIIGALTGVDQVVGAVQGSSGNSEIGIDRFCPGTPPGIVDQITRAMTAHPEEVSAARAILTQWAKGGGAARQRDAAKFQSVWDTTAGMAQALVWTAWGGGDCKVGSGDLPLQTEARRIASRDPGVQSATTGASTGEGGSTPTSSSTLRTVLIATGVGLVLAAAIFLATRRRG